MAWVRGAAIRPVPAYAVVERARLDAVEADLADEGDEARERLDAAFVRFETTQPVLAERVASVLGQPLDETALALGYFLSIAIWLAFEQSFGDRLGLVTDDALGATDAALALEEELRATYGGERFDLEDVVAMEQPGIVSFVHGHVEAALDPDDADRPQGTAVDDVHLVYRMVLALMLALSHAVAPSAGAHPASGAKEMLA